MNESTARANDRYLAPDRFTRRVLNPLVRWLTRRGLGVAGSRELRVVGRRSGAVRSTVVNLLELDGTTYLVAPRGATDWVRNLRVAGRGELAVGRRVTAFTADELPDARKAPVLRAYVARWAWEAGRFFEGLGRDATDDQLAALAPGFPVFVVHLA